MFPGVQLFHLFWGCFTYPCVAESSTITILHQGVPQWLAVQNSNSKNDLTLDHRKAMTFHTHLYLSIHAPKLRFCSTNKWFPENSINQKKCWQPRPRMRGTSQHFLRNVGTWLRPTSPVAAGNLRELELREEICKSQLELWWANRGKKHGNQKGTHILQNDVIYIYGDQMM